MPQITTPCDGRHRVELTGPSTEPAPPFRSRPAKAWPKLLFVEGLITRQHNRAVELGGVGDCRQARYFEDELRRQLDALGRQSAVLQAALARKSLLGQIGQIHRIQGELRACAIERRRLADMISAISQRFPTAGNRAP